MEVAQRYIDEFDRHLKDLNILPATEYPRATEEINRIIEGVADLVDKGFAYPKDGDVYYRVKNFPIMENYLAGKSKIWKLASGSM